VEAHIPNKNIFIDQLQEMFSNIASNTDWDMSKPMLWGHFFTHAEPSRLESIIPKLEAMGLKYVDLYRSDKDEENEPDLFWLHMEEVRIHSPESLDRRNDEFFLFSHREGIASYDGMDCGPVSDQ
jgi:hypothetical protein